MVMWQVKNHDNLPASSNGHNGFVSHLDQLLFICHPFCMLMLFRSSKVSLNCYFCLISHENSFLVKIDLNIHFSLLICGTKTVVSLWTDDVQRAVTWQDFLASWYLWYLISLLKMFISGTTLSVKLCWVIGYPPYIKASLVGMLFDLHLLKTKYKMISKLINCLITNCDTVIEMYWNIDHNFMLLFVYQGLILFIS